MPPASGARGSPWSRRCLHESDTSKREHRGYLCTAQRERRYRSGAPDTEVPTNDTGVDTLIDWRQRHPATPSDNRRSWRRAPHPQLRVDESTSGGRPTLIFARAISHCDLDPVGQSDAVSLRDHCALAEGEVEFSCVIIRLNLSPILWHDQGLLHLCGDAIVIRLQ